MPAASRDFFHRGASSRPPLAPHACLLAAGVTLAVAGWQGSALAAEIEAASRIEAVTVFPDAAQVSRIAEINLPAGSNSILFKGLPRGLDPNSIRIQAGAEAQVSIGSVAASIVPAARPAIPSSIAEKLRALTNERNLLNETMRGLRAKKQMIERYAQASPEKLGDKAAPMNVDDWSKAWNAVGDGLAKVAEEIQAAQIRMRDLQQEIRTLQASNRGAASGSQPSHVVRVDVDAGAATKIRMTLTYRVGGARWTPVYDARLQTGGTSGKPSLELIRRASITQRTGEDWSNVALTVSTVRAHRGTQAPDLLAQILDFYTPPPAAPAPMARNEARRRAQALADRANGPTVGGLLMQKRALEPARELDATVDAGPFEARFRVPGRTDLAADGSARVFRLATRSIEPEMWVRATPALDTTAYLEAVFVNKDESPLLPGLVNLHRDGVYAGRGRFTLVPPGDKVTLGFGADDSIKVQRVPVAKTQKGPGWIGNNRTEITDFATSITNLHPFAVKVRISDRIPVSENNEIVVSPLPSNTKPSEEKVDGKRGVMAWIFELTPKQARTIRLGWQVQWPNGQRVVPRHAPQ